MQPNDDRPEHIHMVVCAAGFFACYAILRFFQLNHLVASLVVIVVSVPLMYGLLPITTAIYFLVSKAGKRRQTIHTTDAGISVLVFFIIFALMVGVLGHSKRSHSGRKNVNEQSRNKSGAPLANAQAK